MSDLTDLEAKLINMEKRLANAEMALFALFALTEELLPPGTQRIVNKMMDSYHEASEGLGVKFVAKFITADESLEEKSYEPVY